LSRLKMISSNYWMHVGIAAITSGEGQNFRPNLIIF
jgi:hypothetical protein